MAVLDAEHDRTRQPRGIGADVRNVAAFAGDRLQQKPPERVVADARDQPRLQAQTGAAEGGIGRRAAEVLGEARHLLEPGADLLRVEVDREPAEADDVQRTSCSEVGQVAHG